MSDIPAAVSRPDNLAPHSQEAEEAVLGSILIEPQTLHEVAAFLQSADFFIVRNAWVWDAILAVSARGGDIDNLTVIQELRTRGQLESIGGSAYIAYLINNTPTHKHAATYAHLVEKAATRRRLLAAASAIAQISLEENAELDDVLAEAETTLFAVTERSLRHDIVPMQVATSEYFDHVEKMYAQKDLPPGIPTGFHDLDALLHGFQKSDLVIIAARPGMGKSSFITSCALSGVRLGRANTAISTMEMSRQQLLQRIFAGETGINAQTLGMGHLSDSDWERFVEATGRLAGLPIFFDDTPMLTIGQLRSKCMHLHREYGLDVIYVDYLQLMSAGTKTNNRVEEIGIISRQLKELAKELNVPVIAAAQLSRAVEQRKDKRPILSDLRESGSIEADADIVMFLYRDDVYNEFSSRPNQADVIIAKHRNGPTGTISLLFKKELTQFLNLPRTKTFTLFDTKPEHGGDDDE